jgi:hypothetical protein
MIGWLNILLIFRIAGLCIATFLALWAFASFACIWHGSYSHSNEGKAGFNRSFGVCAIQGIITLMGAVLFVYLSIRHY